MSATCRMATGRISLLLLLGSHLGCSVTLPDPPTATYREITKQGAFVYTRKSQFVEALEATPTSPALTPAMLAALIDASWRCEQRMNTLVKKVSDERTGQALLTILGGSASAASGIISASLDKSQGDAKTALAAVSAGSAIVAVVGGVIGAPGETIQLYLTALSEYRSATNIVLCDKDGPMTAAWAQRAGEVLKHLNTCGDAVKPL